MEYTDKYHMTQQEAVSYAKRNIVDYIWKSANLEGINITFPETQQVIEGGNIAHLRVDEIVTINNLKHAWQFVFNSLNHEENINLLKSINAIIGSNLINNPGQLRVDDVRIGGTSWRPEIPNLEKIQDDLEQYNKIENVTNRVITKMCYLMRCQIFWDGNKRTSMLFANKEMIQYGKGIINIPVELKSEFGTKLLEYYQRDDMEELKQFIYDKCIDGANFTKG